MSKNLTRKGLAFGAIVALGASLFSAAPAFAADELTLAPTTGTLYKTIEGESFSLLAGLAPATPAGNTVQLKYSVTTTATLGSMANAVVNGTAAATTAVTAGQPTNTTVYKLTTGSPTVGSVQRLVVASPTAVTAGTPATAAVTAFFDANNNDVLDSGEFTSATRTITWTDAADVVAAVTLTAPSEGDLAIKANVALTGYNQEQISNAHLGFLVTAANGTSTVGGLTLPTATNVPAYVAGTAHLAPAALASGTYAINVTTTALGTTGGVKVSVRYLATATTIGDFLPGVAGTAHTIANLVGTEVGTATAAITARTIASLQASSVLAANIAASAENNTIVSNVQTAAVDNAAASRLNTEFVVQAVVKSSTPAVVASVPVLAKIEVGSAITLGSSVTVTVNGTTYSTNASLPTALALTSDADGVVKVTVNTAGFTVAANKNVKVTFSAQGFSDAIVVTPAALDYTLFEDGDLVVANNTRSAVKGSSVSLSYTMVDQFKQTPATGTYRLVATASAGAGITAGATYVALSAGKAKVSYTPSATGTFTVTPTIELLDTTTSNYGAFTVNSSDAARAQAADVVVIAAQTDAVTATSSSSTTAVAIADKAEKAVDTRLSINTANAYVTGEATTISGTASQDVTGITRSGAAVTVSGAGLLFSTAYNGTVFSADSITVYADTSGAYSVVALSNIAGSFTVTVTVGNATKTATAKFATASANASAIAWSTLPAQAQAGRTVDLAAVVTDKWGNVVSGANVNFTNTGVGYVQNTADVATDANGKATGRLIVLQNDLGTSYLSATLNITTDVVVAKSVEFGLTDVDVVAGGHRVFVNAEFAKGRTVTVTIDGKRVYSKVQTTDNAVELAFTQKKKGSHTVTVRISGGIVATEKVTTN